MYEGQLKNIQKGLIAFQNQQLPALLHVQDSNLYVKLLRCKFGDTACVYICTHEYIYLFIV